jgi:hypothetical protein
MTPTEQDKELREKIHSALFADDFPILNDIEKDAVDRIVAIIQDQKADRKRVALEARIDEATRGLSLSGKYEHRQYFTGRIAGLKAQQEEV